MNMISEEVLALEPDIIAWRRHMHQNPELSFQEVHTTAYLTEELKKIPGLTLEFPTKTGVVAVLSYLLGPHWILFALFLGLNVADWLTGWMKSRIAHKESSSAGWKGVLKKLGYWIMIVVAFGASTAFIEIGDTIGIDLGITTLLGWFVLASLLVNEIRSILENFVEMGYKVPKILVNGLEVADKKINQNQDEETE